MYEAVKIYSNKYNDKSRSDEYIRIVNLANIKGYTHGYTDENTINLIYVNEGRCIIEYDQKELLLFMKDMVIIPPIAKYTISCSSGDKPVIAKCICTRDKIIEKIETIKSEFVLSSSIIKRLFEMRQIICLKRSVSLCHRIEQIMNDISNEYSEKKKGYQTYLLFYLTEILILLERELERSMDDDLQEDDGGLEKNKDIINNVLEYINLNYNNDISLDKACRHAMLSKSYFSYLFKVNTGKTFTEYLNDIRIRKSMELIEAHKSSINLICYEAGFKNICHFNRMFKKTVGLSPTLYRKQRVENNMV